MKTAIVLLFSAFALFWVIPEASAQLRAPWQKQRHRALNVPYYQNVNPEGAFLPISGSPQSPTRVELTDIHSSLASADGTMIKIDAVGGFSPYPLPAPDDADNRMIGIFVNSSGQSLAPGGRTTAPLYLSQTFCGQPLDIPNDFFIKYPGSPEYLVEIPAGAVALLVAPIDCPVEGNHDSNGNFKVKITYPVLNYEIYQTVRQPSLFTPDIVDLVAGKNADVLVELGPGLDVSNSQIIFENSAGGSAAVSADVTTADSSGIVQFKIDPVPEGNSFLGLNSMKIIMKDATNNIIAEKETNVRIHKTKQLKIAYLPISGCNFSPGACFPQSSDSLVNRLMTIGSTLIDIMFPLKPSAGLSIKLPSQAIATEIKEYNCDEALAQDAANLQRIFNNRNALNLFSSATYLYGIVHKSYFESYHSQCAGLNSGVTFRRLFPNVALGALDGVATVPHEIGHLLRLEDITADDPNIIISDGYQNVDLADIDISRGRGLLPNLENFMSAERNSTSATNSWISKIQYLRLVSELGSKKNTSKVIGDNVLRVDAILRDNELKILSAYMKNSLDISTDSEGEYIVQVKDRDDLPISEFNFQGTILSDGSELFAFEVFIQNDAMFVDLYKNSTFLKKIVIPADIMLDEIKNINPNSVRTNYSQATINIRNAISNFKSSLIQKNYRDAYRKINSEIAPEIMRNINMSYVPATYLDATSLVFNKVLTQSLLRIKYDLPNEANPFMNIMIRNNPLANEKCKLEIQLLKKPDNPDFIFIQQVWFNGERVALKNVDGRLFAESPRLPAGTYQWAVQNYVIESKFENQFNESLLYLNKERFRLELEYEDETNVDNKLEIGAKIQRVQERIVILKQMHQNNRKEIGSVLTLNFEVL